MELTQHQSVLVIDEQNMVANGIKLLIGSFFKAFLNTNEPTIGMEIAVKHQPELIIIDTTFPDLSAENFLRELKFKLPKSSILIYTNQNSPEFIIKHFRCGINGFVLKTTEDDEFVKAVKLLLNGKDFFCKESRIHIVNRFIENNQKGSITHLIANTKFSDKELEIIKLTCKQMNAKEISQKLSLTERTVEQYRNNISKRIGAKNIAGIMRFALQNDIIKIEEL